MTDEQIQKERKIEGVLVKAIDSNEPYKSNDLLRLEKFATDPNKVSFLYTGMCSLYTGPVERQDRGPKRETSHRSNVSTHSDPLPYTMTTKLTR